ncbi:triose-phosphate isomerase [Candidatus Woesearchaeota archaeon]|nr:triose-phosphate isomerase [Candidatus Woesearchaeota archaeon]
MQRLIAGNWKMNKEMRQCKEYAESFNAYFKETMVEVLVCPPLPFVYYLARHLHPLVKLGAQDVAAFEPGPYTGEISATMARSVGCLYSIVGHSERRKYFGEDDKLINIKARLARQHAITPIICVGETSAQRKAGKAKAIVKKQVLSCTNKLAAPSFVIAYEPLWAIGTGKNAAPEQAEDMHAFIRQLLTKKYKGKGKDVRIIYGGSVTPENCVPLIRQKNVNGFLVGGVSLDAKRFCEIIAKCGM